MSADQARAVWAKGQPVRERRRPATPGDTGIWAPLSQAAVPRDLLDIAGDDDLPRAILTHAIRLADTGEDVTEADLPILAPTLTPTRQLRSLCSAFVYYIGKYQQGRDDSVIHAHMAAQILATLFQLSTGEMACNDCLKTAVTADGLKPRFRDYVDCQAHRDARWALMEQPEPATVRAPWASAT